MPFKAPMRRFPAMLGAGAFLLTATMSATPADAATKRGPDTRITKRPAAKTTKRSATIQFAAVGGKATFQCRLDGGKWQRCASPAQLTKLSHGKHRLAVRAVDRAGRAGAPKRVNWTVVAPAKQRSAPNKAASGATPSSWGRCSSALDWCGSYEKGHFGEWDGFNGTPNGPIANNSPGKYFQTVKSPTIDGGHAFKATVDPGAATGGQAGQRTLAYLFPGKPASSGKTKAYQGSDRWYRTAVYFPHDFKPAPNSVWNWIVEWHNWPDGPCCANLGFSVVTDGTDGGKAGGERLSLRVLGGGSASNPLQGNMNIGDSAPSGYSRKWYPGPNIQRGRWYDILVHVKWDYTSKGKVEYWLNGSKMVSYDGPTLFYYADNGQGGAGPSQAYWMQGYYRGGGDSTTSVIHDGARIGPTLESVR